MTVPGRKLDVELVETDDADLDELGAPFEPGGAVPHEQVRSAWTWRRVRRAWPLAVVALLVAAAYGVTGARERAADAARLEALGGQRGFVADLSRPLRPEWTASTDSFYVGAVHAGVAVVESWGSSDDLVQAALDVRTGFELWSLSSAAESPRSCWRILEADYATGPALACSIHVESSGGRAEGGTYQLTRGFRIEHRDLATGDLLAESAERVVLAAAPLGVDLVEVVLQDGGTVLRRVGLDGEVRWATRLADQPDAALFYSHVFTDDETALLVVADRAFAVSAAGRVIVDHRFDPSGRSGLDAEVAEFGLAFYGHIDSTGAGQFVVTDRENNTSVYEADGDLLDTASPGWPLRPLDDGSLGRLLTFGGDELAVIDLDSGAELLRDQESQVSAILDGAVIVEGLGKVRSIDGRSGEERWSVPGGQVVASDGRFLLVHESDGLSYVLRALDAHSGEERWRVDLGPDTWPDVLDGRVFVRGAGGIALYGP